MSELAPTASTSVLAAKPPGAAGESRLRAIARNAFPFLVVALLWEITAHLGVFPRRLFPSLEEVAAAFVRLTAAGILPHHVLDTLLRLLAGFALAAVVGVAIGIADGPLAPGRGHLPAAGEHRRADPRPRLCAAVPAVVRARQQDRRCCWSASCPPSRSSSTPGPA